MRRFSQRMKKQFEALLDLPKDVVHDLPRITLVGPYQMYIENHRGVKSFTQSELQLNLSRGVFKVTGDQLVIRAIHTEEVFIEGMIISTSFIVKED